MSDALSEDADYPQCPFCESNVFVGRSRGGTADWHCYYHEVEFGGAALDPDDVPALGGQHG